MNSFLQFPGITFRLAQLKGNQSAYLGREMSLTRGIGFTSLQLNPANNWQSHTPFFPSSNRKNSYIHFPVHNPFNEPIRQVSLDETN